MRLYNGKPLVNSVTAKNLLHEGDFPLGEKVRRCGGWLDHHRGGQSPRRRKGGSWRRGALFRRPLSYGIPRSDILIDPLTMAVSAGQDAALVTLDALERVKRELGVKTSLGVSNVSFGAAAAGKYHLCLFPHGAAAWVGRRHYESQIRGHDARVPLLLRPFRLG